MIFVMIKYTAVANCKYIYKFLNQLATMPVTYELKLISHIKIASAHQIIISHFSLILQNDWKIY